MAPPWACGAAKGLAQGLEVAQTRCYKIRLVHPALVQDGERGKGSTCSLHLLAESSQPAASYNTGSPAAVKWPRRETLLKVVLW